MNDGTSFEESLLVKAINISFCLSDSRYCINYYYSVRTLFITSYKTTSPVTKPDMPAFLVPNLYTLNLRYIPWVRPLLEGSLSWQV